MTSRSSVTPYRAFRIAYDGRPWRGFQRQPDVPTVEGALLDAFEELGVDGTAAGYAAAGRTDAGVSAVAQTIAVTCPEWLDPAALNGELPATIRAWAHADVPDTFHPQYDPTCRAYTYLHYAPSADVDRIRIGADRLEGTHDFTHLTPDRGHTTRELSALAIERADPFVRISVRAPGFLRHQVRRIVSLLDGFGRGTYSTAEVESMLAVEPLPGHRGIPPAPPEPLVLTDVVYPDVEFHPHPDASGRVAKQFRQRERDLQQVASTMGTIADYVG